MKIISKLEANKFIASEECTVLEYMHNDNDVNGAIAEISGRYPKNNFALNKISKEIVYILEGNGKIGLENEIFELKAGDVVLINPNEKFYWEGDFKLFMVCNPAFDPNQHIEVE